MTTATENKLERIALDIQGGVARIVLRNPPLNVIDIPTMDEVARAVVEIESHAEVSVIALMGDGKGFSAGVDVAAHTPDKVEEMLGKFHGIIRALVATRKVTVAFVHGPCMGGGAELAIVCDFVYTTDGAQWGFPEIKLGCYPPVACAALASLVGQKRAADLILTGRTVTGQSAAEFGLATRSVAEDQMRSVIEESIGHLLSLSPAALAVAKRASYAWDSMHFDKGLARAEKTYVEDLMKTADSQEGIRAFMEKRQPKWTGK